MQIHLATDDKFIDYFIKRQRKCFPNTECRYVIVSNSNVLQFVKSTQVELCKSTTEDILALFKGKSFSKVYIHFFKPFFYEAIIQLPLNTKLYWIFFGAEAFSRPKLYSLYLDPFSSNFYHKNFYAGKKYKILNRGFRLKSTWDKYFEFIRDNRLAKMAFKRVDYFCHYILEDYLFIKSKFGMKAEFIDFHYCSVSDLVIGEIDYNPSKEIALIGNSGSEANNHVSLLYVLKNQGRVFEKLICPLSYGGDEVYVNEVLTIGKKLFGEAFFPVLNFLPKKEYDQMLLSSASFYHNHYRSQAYGNIAYQLYIGGHVYLNSKSSLYRYLCSNQIGIGSINAKKIIPPSNIARNAEGIIKLLSDECTNLKYEKVLK
jgi:dTDP-N-acetylfucosamine:lipid II N-acetylfucosaminyltransferase